MEPMTIALTGPVSAFFEAERTRDLEALARCFSDHAVVQDEGRTIEGRVEGAFPNSPLELEHVFVVEGGRIASLEIR